MVKRILAALTLVLIGVSSAQARIYTVKRGDSLYKIAHRFHISIRELKRANHLRSNILRPGQRLYIPPRFHSRAWYRQFRPEKSTETISFIEKKSEVERNISSISSEMVPLTNAVYQEAEELSDVLSTPLNVKYDNWSLSILNNPEYKGIFFKTLAQVFKELKNTPYVFGGNNPKFGLDCSSFTMYVYRKLGVKLPRTARAQYNFGIPIDRHHLKVGDLVFFRTYARYPSHVGIYIGNGKFIHFSSMYHGLAISSLNDRYFRRRFIGARRVLSEKKIKQLIYAQTK
ncbi:C40 family peptidase [Thermovibrio ammonificans]|jgi:LysM repeat protein|uniref:C40 family peptidase n=1 Tax=Thermovibrio ammonificans TaxID=228745 RepID=UPI000A000FAE|nr:C40 family peptidase [Thermovibrio ammonificans]